MDLSQKVKRAARSIGGTGGSGGGGGLAGAGTDGSVGGVSGVNRTNPVKDQQIAKVIRDGHRIVAEEVIGLVAADIKKGLFQNITETS